MLAKVFLGLSLVGSEWVLYLLLGLSVYSVAVMIERWRFYCNVTKGLDHFRAQLRQSLNSGQIEQALSLAKSRAQTQSQKDLDTELALAILNESQRGKNPLNLTESAIDAVLRAKLSWDKNLSTLGTIGSNAPFIGLFGTVLGIIKAFHDLSQQAGAAAQTVTAGISEALVATAVGLLVAIPAVVAYNLFQRKVKVALTEAEALKSFLIGKIAQ